MHYSYNVEILNAGALRFSFYANAALSGKIDRREILSDAVPCYGD
jgi:hypothetical protein